MLEEVGKHFFPAQYIPLIRLRTVGTHFFPWQYVALVGLTFNGRFTPSLQALASFYDFELCMLFACEVTAWNIL